MKVQLTAEQAEEEFGPLWDVLGLAPRTLTATKSRIVVVTGHSAWLVTDTEDTAPVRIKCAPPSEDSWIGVEQARILKQLLLGE